MKLKFKINNELTFFLIYRNVCFKSYNFIIRNNIDENDIFRNSIIGYFKKYIWLKIKIYGNIFVIPLNY